MMHVGLSGDNRTMKNMPRYAPDTLLEAGHLAIDQDYSIHEAAQAVSVGVCSTGNWAMKIQTEREDKAV